MDSSNELWSAERAGKALDVRGAHFRAMLREGKIAVRVVCLGGSTRYVAADVKLAVARLVSSAGVQPTQSPRQRGAARARAARAAKRAALLAQAQHNPDLAAP